MPDLARNVRTGQICSAAELTVQVHLQADTFRCIGCQVAMSPVAVAPDADYKVAPHFKVARDFHHAAGCDWDGSQVAAQRALRYDALAPRNLASWVPDRLRLAQERPQADPQDVLPNAAAAPRRVANAHGGEAPGRHDAVAGTLHRVAECYLRLPNWRPGPLALPGCKGRTYDDCFEPLGTTRRPPAETKAYFDIVSFEKTELAENTLILEVPLGPTAYVKDKEGKYRLSGRYRVRIDMRAWTATRRLGFIRDVRHAMHNQRDLRRRGIKESILLFFLSAPDPNDPTLFHVADGRLACFLQGMQPARQRPKTSGRGASRPAPTF